MKNLENYHEFLQLGYLSQKSKVKNIEFNFYESINKTEKEDLLNIGFELLNNNVNEIINNKNVVVPISGGLDSRLLLSSVLENKNAKDVNTLTFGTPGSLDYEIGNKIAKKIGTKHLAINIEKLNFNIEELYLYGSQITNPVVMFHNLPARSFNLGNESVVLSGYLGDVISGKRLNEDSENDWQTEKLNYFTWMTNRHSFNVDNKKLLNELTENSFFQSENNLTKKEVIFMKEHNEKLNRHQVLGNINNVKTPFFNNEFMNFLISLPKELRLDQNFYKELIFKKYNSSLNDIAVKNFYGSKFNSTKVTKLFNRNKNAVFNRLSKKVNFISNPYVNYVDFKLKLYTDEKFKKLILNLLNSLKERDIGEYKKECERVIYEINKNKVANPYDFLLLSSLEIYIRTERI